MLPGARFTRKVTFQVVPIAEDLNKDLCGVCMEFWILGVCGLVQAVTHGSVISFVRRIGSIILFITSCTPPRVAVAHFG
jgi:hypothetical protein